MNIANLVRKPITWLIAAALIALAAWWLVATLTGGKRAKVQANLGREQTGAAIRSGKDAVETLGQRQASDAALDGKVNDAKRAIDNATDAAGADAAGRDGLCRVSPDLCRQHPMQQPRPR